MHLVHFFIQIASLKIEDTVVETVNIFLIDLSFYPSGEFRQARNSPAYDKIEFSVYLLSPYLPCFNILQTESCLYLIHHLDLLANGINQQERSLGNSIASGIPGKPPPVPTSIILVPASN